MIVKTYSYKGVYNENLGFMEIKRSEK